MLAVWTFLWEDFRELSPDFLFGIFKALSHKVDGLVLCDWVLLHAGLAGVKGQHLGFVCQAVLSGRKRKRDHNNHTSNMRNYSSQRKNFFFPFFFSMDTSAVSAKQEVQPH